MTAAEWWWMLMWNLYSPGCWLNVINSLSGPIPVPNWSIQVPQHQLNCDVSPYYLQSTIYWAAVHISQRHSDYLSHHFPQGRTNNCRFPLLRELIWKKKPLRFPLLLFFEIDSSLQWTLNARDSVPRQCYACRITLSSELCTELNEKRTSRGLWYNSETLSFVRHCLCIVESHHTMFWNVKTTYRLECIAVIGSHALRRTLKRSPEFIHMVPSLPPIQ